MQAQDSELRFAGPPQEAGVVQTQDSELRFAGPPRKAAFGHLALCIGPARYPKAPECFAAGGSCFICWHDIRKYGLRMKRCCLQTMIALFTDAVLIAVPALRPYFSLL